MGILAWHYILAAVVEGFDQASRVAPGEIGIKNEEIGPILNGAKSARKLKDVWNNHDLKRFFENHQLTDVVVDQLAEKGTQSIVINDFDPESLKTANYDLRLGDEAYVTTDRLPKRLTKINDSVVIRPGEFGILTTHEYIHVPEHLLGLISLRFNYKKLGLVNISGFHVDPGFTGKIIFSVFNTGPRDVVLRYLDPVFMIMFETMEKADGKYETRYAGSFNKQKHIPVDIVTALGGQSVSVISLDRRLRSLETQLRILEGVLIALAVPVLAYLAQLLLKYLK